MKIEYRMVTHVDGMTPVKAKGYIKGNEFVGEYKFKGMTYGVNIPINSLPAKG